MTSPKSLATLGTKKSRLSPSPSDPRHHDFETRHMNNFSGSVQPRQSTLNVSDQHLEPIRQSLDQQSHLSQNRKNPSSLQNMSKSAFMDQMSRRDIFLHKKLKDQQVLQLHTRLQYLVQENKKKARQIETAQKKAELAFENQIQSKHLNLQSKLQGCAEKI